MNNCKCPHVEDYDDGQESYENCGFFGQPTAEIEQCHLSDVNLELYKEKVNETD